MQNVGKQHGSASRERFAHPGAGRDFGPPGLQADHDLSEDGAQEVHQRTPVARTRVHQGSEGTNCKFMKYNRVATGIESWEKLGILLMIRENRVLNIGEVQKFRPFKN